VGTADRPCAGSVLVAGLLDRTAPLREVTRTRSSVHYAAPDPAVPMLTVGLPTAVRLPHSLVVPALPAPGSVLDTGDFRVTRWWQPPRPTGLVVTDPAPVAALATSTYDRLDPDRLVGSGPGLTPSGDDVLAGALVTARATGDPRLATWSAATRRALRRRTTTFVSRALLHDALAGWCVPELARLLVALARHPADLGAAAAALRAVGHSSGQSLLDGVAHTLLSLPSHRSEQGAA
jgi:hypothetical protein